MEWFLFLAKALWRPVSVHVVGRWRARAQLRRVARHMADKPGMRWTQRPVRRWLRTTARLEVLLAGEGPEDASRQLHSELRRSRKARKASESELRDLAAHLVERAQHARLALLAPSESVAVAASQSSSEHADLNAELTGVRVTVERLADQTQVPERLRASLSLLPPTVHEPLVELAELRPDLVVNLLPVLLAEQPRRELAFAQLVQTERSPDWLRGAPSSVWLVLAEFAVSHNLNDVACKAFEQAARTGAGVPARLLARAALAAANAEDMARGTVLLQEAWEWAPEDSFVKVVDACVKEDAEAIKAVPAIGGLTRTEQLLVGMLRAKAVGALGDLDGAVAIARDLRIDASREAMAAVYLAQFLVHRAADGNSPATDADLATALRLAVEARDARRLWGGRTGLAVAVACAAAAQMGQLDLVLRLSAPPPDGEATAEELDTPEVLSSLAFAAQAHDRLDLVESVAHRVDHPFYRQVAASYLAHVRDHDVEAARRLMLDGLEAAETSGQRKQGLLVLAELGTWPLPGWDELVVEEPVEADVLAAISEAERGRLDEAIRRLRPRQMESPRSAKLLANLHLRAGEQRRAAEVFENAGRRFKDAALLGSAAEVFGALDLSEDVRRTAEAALALVDIASEAAQRLRKMLLDRAIRQELWDSAELHARGILDQDPQQESVRWTLAWLWARQYRFELAWNELQKLGAPATADAGRLWVAVASKTLHGEEWIPTALQLGEQFPDEQELRAQVLIATWMDRRGELPADLAARVQTAVQRFTEDFPDSRLVFAQSLPDDPNEMVETLRGMLEPRARHLTAVSDAIRQGRLPLGMMSYAAKRTYTEVLVHGGVGLLPICDLNEAVLAEEVEVVEAALINRVVADLSALHVSGLAGCWPTVRASFDVVVVATGAADDARTGADLLQRPGDGTIGWDVSIDRPTVSDPDPAADELARDHGVAIRDRLATCDLLPTRGELVAQFPKEATAFMGALTLAAESNVPLYADDVALRAIARQLGVPAFGTVALLQVLETKGLLSSDAHREGINRLRAARCADLPFDAEALLDLAEQENWKPISAAFHLSRSRSWTDPAAALTFYRRVRETVAQGDPSAYAGWLYAAVLGGSSRLSPTAAQEVAGMLLANAVLDLAADRELVSRCLDAARQATSELGLEDPLGFAASTLFQFATEISGPDLARLYVATAFSEVAEADMQVVLSTLPPAT